ncbi:bifunctional diguanylate cyclase/phosphodiesterase [Saccharothrix xinjiangensis]|uniref:Bifunctional diguanylate cyclase/phosphodiesterase n=1 Tax=Saccharothrix xinjiangensis TaxID=204798 RepID=A0ABV9XZE3_9PSEU
MSDRQLRAVFDAGLAPLPDAEVEARLARLLAGDHTAGAPAVAAAHSVDTREDPTPVDRARIRVSRGRGRSVDMIGEWVDAIAATNLHLDRAALRKQVGVFASALIDHVRGQPYGQWPAQRIGRHLAAELRMTPHAFQDALEVIIPWLEHTAAACEPAGRRRLTVALAGLAAGFADGARDRVFDEQLLLTRAAGTVPPTPPPALHDTRLFIRQLDSCPQPGCVLTTGGILVRANPALRALLGEDRGTAVIGSPLSRHTLTASDAVAVEEALRRANQATDGWSHTEFALVVADSAPGFRVVAAFVRRVDHHPDGHRFNMVLRDITAWRSWSRRLLPGRDYDPITNLPTQRNFLHRVHVVLQHRQSDLWIGLCTLRLDGLASITRTLGPRVGARVERAIAARITAAVQATPATVVGRLDRDVFAVLLTNPHGRSGVTDTVRRLVDWLSQPLWDDGHELVLRPLVGVTEAHPHTSAGQLLTQAQAALHANSDRVPRRSAVRPQCRQPRDIERAHLLAALPAALQRGEINIAYTPIARLHDGVVVGAEATAWWHHPELGVRQVDDLLTLADDIGLSLRWGPWLLRRVLAQAARWRHALGEAAPRVTVHIPRRFADSGTLVDHVRDALEEAGVPAAQLMLSMPEAAVVDERGLPRRHVIRLGSMDVRLALEGLGTDVLRYHTLSNLTLHTLVVPPELTATLDDPTREQHEETVAASFIRMSRNLTRVVTVKGITTTAQRDTAHHLAADLGQGELFGGPQSAQQLQDLISAGPLAG